MDRIKSNRSRLENDPRRTLTPAAATTQLDRLEVASEPPVGYERENGPAVPGLAASLADQIRSRPEDSPALRDAADASKKPESPHRDSSRPAASHAFRFRCTRHVHFGMGSIGLDTHAAYGV